MGELEKELTGIKRQIWCIRKELETICETCGGGGGSFEVTRVENYAALPPAADHTDEYFHVLNSQGTSWLPGSLGGTYYSKGFYYSNGTTWEFVGEVPYEATQIDVDAGTITDQFVSPATLANAAQWNTKVSSVTGPAVDNTDPLNPVITIPTNLTFYSTTAASDIPTYNSLVIDINDPDYDSPSVNVPTGAITGLAQPVGVLVSDAGVFAGNPGTINLVTVGEIRRTSGTGVAEFYFEVYQRDSLGTETLVATSNATAPVNVGAYTEFSASCLLNNGNWLSTDRVVLKYYGNRISGGSDPSYEFSFGGTNPVRTLFPISASLLLNVPIAIGVTGVTGGTPGNVLSVSPSGLLSQTTVNSGSGATGQVTFWSGTNTQSGDNGLFWDNTNKRLGIGTITPEGILQIGSRDSSTGVNVLSILRSDIAANQTIGDIILGGRDTSTTPYNWVTLRARTQTSRSNGIFDIITGSVTAGVSTYFTIGNHSTSGGGRCGIFSPNPSARLHLTGSGTTSATTALLIQNSAATNNLVVKDNGSIEIGKNTAGTTQSTASITVISGDTNTGLALVTKGTGAITAQIPDGTTAGGNARGAYAVDFQMARNAATQVASGTRSVILGGNNNTASATSTIAGGENATASGAWGIAIGNSMTASGQYSLAIGGGSGTASGTNSVVIGSSSSVSQGLNSFAQGATSYASANYSAAFGQLPYAYLHGQFAIASGSAGTLGAAQTSSLRLRQIIAGTAKTELFLDGASARAQVAGLSNITSRIWNAKVQLVAVCTTQGNGTVTAGEAFIGNYAVGISRIGSTTSLIGTVQNLHTPQTSTNMADAVVDITADDTNEALKIEFTPPTTAGSTTVIRVVATVYLTEVGY